MHPFFNELNWDDVYNRRTKPSKPYLIRENTAEVKLSGDIHTKDQETIDMMDRNYLIGWSFRKKPLNP